MNEIKLSSDLNVITAEINSYKQVAGQAIFEIGARLKHVKENDLVHGEWGRWCEKLEISRNQATKFIKVYEEFGSNDFTWNHLGLSALYQIATIPEEEREKEHVIPSTGETKAIDEMTSRELEEVKRKLKIAQEEAKQAKHAESVLVRQLEIQYEKAENAEPQVVEVVKEVIPESVQSQISEKERSIESLKRDMQKKDEELKMLRSRIQYVDNQERREQEIKALQYEADKTVLVTKLKMDEFLKDVAFTAFRKGAIAASSEGTRKKLEQGVEELKSFCSEMELALSGRIDLTKQGGNEYE